jgi:HKD family nuclease
LIQALAIDNRGPNTLQNAFRRISLRAREIAIAVPFLDMAGLRMVRENIVHVARKGQVRIIIGISSDAFNDPSCLQSLSVLQEVTGERVEVRVSKFADKFHEKLYMARGEDSLSAIIGSSNLTGKGLSSPSEVNIQLSGTTNEQPLRDLWSYFNRSYRNNSVPLSSSIIQTYRKMAAIVHGRKGVIRVGRLWTSLRAMLGKQALGSAKIAQNTWFDMVSGDLSASVERKVEEMTSWDDWYYSCRSRKTYEEAEAGDFLVLREKTTKKQFLSVNRIIDKTRVRTPQGDLFIAYRQQGNKRAWNDELVRKLRASQIQFPSQNSPAVSLTPKQSEIISSIKSQRDNRAEGGAYKKSFSGKLVRSNQMAKTMAYTLDRFVLSLNGGIVYYPSGNDIRYTHKDVPPRKNGERYPIIHVRPQTEDLIVHLDEGVKVPKDVNYVFTRNVKSPFKLWYRIGARDRLNGVRRNLVRQSFRRFSERHNLQT